MERYLSKFRYLILFACCLLAGLLNAFPSWNDGLKNSNQMLFLFGIVLILLFYFIIYPKKKKIDDKDIIFLVFAIGFIFRLVYIQSTAHTVRQHDVGGSKGHLEYIMRLYNGKGLPDTDVTGGWQYYQPPAWHSLCALWLKIQTKIGITYENALENLQLIPLFCSSAVMFLSHKLFRLFNMKGKPLVIACGIVAFHPIFIMLSGSINNDMLSLTLALLAVVLAVKWFRNPTFLNIILLALAIGLSMAVKLSGGLIAVGVATLFAVKLFGKSHKKKLSLIGQFASFGVLCVPLALWWQIRNYIMFETPLTYVPNLGEKHSQYIGWRTPFERLFDISSIWEQGVYPARLVRDYPIYEYNIPAAALKSSVFGEYYLGQTAPLLSLTAKILFYSAALLAVLSVVATVYMLIKALRERNNFAANNGYTVSELLLPAICAVTMIASYVKFCFDYAHFCTMDFRYIALTVVFGALYVGLLLKDRAKFNKIYDKILVYAVITLTVLMSASSMAIYGSIA